LFINTLLNQSLQVGAVKKDFNNDRVGPIRMKNEILNIANQ